MMYILFLFLMINYAFAFSNLLKRKLLLLLSLVPCLIITIIFISGIFGSFIPGVIFLLILALLSFIYNICSIIKYRKKCIIDSVSLSDLFVLITFVAAFFFLTYNRTYSCWDDFSHWGLALKNFLYFNHFSLSLESTILAKSYLSGTTMFQYFVLKFLPDFSESFSIFVSNFMSFMVISSAIKIFCKEKIGKSLLYSIFILLLCISYFLQAFISLYVDNVLALTFAGALISYFSFRKKELLMPDKLIMISYFILLIVIKDMGLLLGALLGLIMLIDKLFVLNKFNWNFKQNILKFWSIFSLALPSLIIKVIWIIILNVNNAVTQTNELTIINTIKNFIFFGLDKTTIKIVKNYLIALFSTPFYSISILKISFFLIILVITILGIILILKEKNKEEKKKIKLIIISIIDMAIIYSIILLISYCGIFYGYEGIKLASYNRYLGTILLPVSLIIVSMLFDKLKKKTFFLFPIFIGVLCLIMPRENLAINTTNVSKEKHEINFIRNHYKKCAQKIKENVKLGEKIYYIHITSNGFEYYIFKYEASPLMLHNTSSWSLGSKQYSTDIYSQDISIDEFKKTLIENNYSYVYYYSGGPGFADKYGSIFEKNEEGIIASKSLYKVTYDNNKVFLKRVNKNK